MTDKSGGRAGRHLMRLFLSVVAMSVLTHANAATADADREKYRNLATHNFLAHVNKYWDAMPGGVIGRLPADSKCQVSLTLNEDGMIQQIDLSSCDGSPEFHYAALQFLRNAEPFPVPGDAEFFEEFSKIDLLLTSKRR